jgi:hypothetical protein
VLRGRLAGFVRCLAWRRTALPERAAAALRTRRRAVRRRHRRFDVEAPRAREVGTGMKTMTYGAMAEWLKAQVC